MSSAALRLDSSEAAAPPAKKARQVDWVLDMVDENALQASQITKLEGTGADLKADLDAMLCENLRLEEALRSAEELSEARRREGATLTEALRRSEADNNEGRRLVEAACEQQNSYALAYSDAQQECEALQAALESERATTSEQNISIALLLADCGHLEEQVAEAFLLTAAAEEQAAEATSLTSAAKQEGRHALASSEAQMGLLRRDLELRKKQLKGMEHLGEEVLLLRAWREAEKAHTAALQEVVIAADARVAALQRLTAAQYPMVQDQRDSLGRFATELRATQKELRQLRPPAEQEKDSLTSSQ